MVLLQTAIWFIGDGVFNHPTIQHLADTQTEFTGHLLSEMHTSSLFTYGILDVAMDISAVHALGVVPHDSHGDGL